MIVNILITIVFFFILMYASVNLLGLLVRGLFVNPELDKLEKETEHDFIKKEIAKSKQAGKAVNIIALVLIIGFYYALFHFWNLGVVLAAGLVMAGRLPTLVFEITHGTRDVKQMKGFWSYVATILPWLGLPVLYFSLYK